MKIAALAGGVGGSKLLLGLYRVMDPADLTIIVNTGDDIVMHGLHVSPDPDIITYTLAGVVNEETGWGIVGESFRVAEGLARYGRPVWFKLGDRDLATHIHRSALLKDGGTLSQAMESIRTGLGVRVRLLPMSDDPMPTMLDTDEGRMHLQDYLVRRRCEPRLKSIAFEGAERARPAPGVIEAIEERPRHRHLAEQSADQHRADPRGAWHSRGFAQAARGCRRRVPFGRRQVAQGPIGQDDGRARPRGFGAWAPRSSIAISAARS